MQPNLGNIPRILVGIVMDLKNIALCEPFDFLLLLYYFLNNLKELGQMGSKVESCRSCPMRQSEFIYSHMYMFIYLF